MFRVKICGITTGEDAHSAADAGADAIGLNFYPRSPRYVTPQEAKQIVNSVGARVLSVGVMVNPSEEEALSIATQVGLGAIQLHGDEPASVAARLSRTVAVVKAFRISTSGLRPVLEYLDEVRKSEGLLRAVLFDAYRPGQFGGSGETADWGIIQQYRPKVEDPPFVLAGGLTPDNVATAIQRLRPAGVDTASGVERSPGRKDAALVAQFVRAARMAFSAVG